MSKESLCYKENIRNLCFLSSFRIEHWKKGVEIIMKKAGLKIGRLQSDSYDNIQSR